MEQENPVPVQGFFTLQQKDLTPRERELIEDALKSKDTYISTENDGVLAWLILLLFCALCGLGAGVVEIDGDFSFSSFKYIFTNIENSLGELGILSGTLVTIWTVWFFFRVHGRWGYIVLPSAVGKIRGRRITLIRYEHIAKYSSRMVTAGKNDRSFSALEIYGIDGSHRTFYSAGRLHAALKENVGI